MVFRDGKPDGVFATKAEAHDFINSFEDDGSRYETEKVLIVRKVPPAVLAPVEAVIEQIRDFWREQHG